MSRSKNRLPTVSRQFLTRNYPRPNCLLNCLLPLRGLECLSPNSPHDEGNCETVLAHRNRSDFCDLRLRCLTRTPEIARFQRQEKAMLHCDLSVRWKVASDLRFRAAISEPKTSSFCGISGDLAQSTRKSLAIAIVRFWCAKETVLKDKNCLAAISGSRHLDVSRGPWGSHANN